MQIKKEDIKHNILKVAKQEFLKHGFKDTSMRTIASKANVGLSNIYNYFKNKDEIFCVILSPLIKELEKLAANHNNEINITSDVFTFEDYQIRTVNEYIVIIKNYRDVFRLLLFKANGSSLENYLDTYSDVQTEIGLEYIKLMKKKYPKTNTNISKFFIHNTVSWWLSIIREIISHEELTKKQIEQFLKEFIIFGTAGWQKIMNLNSA